MRVCIKHPKRKPYFADVKNKLECLQRTVGGDIEVLPVEDIYLLIDADAKIKEKQYNCYFYGFDFFGTMIFCGHRGAELTSLTISAKEFKERYPELYEEE